MLFLNFESTFQENYSSSNHDCWQAEKQRGQQIKSWGYVTRLPNSML